VVTLPAHTPVQATRKDVKPQSQTSPVLHDIKGRRWSAAKVWGQKVKSVLGKPEATRTKQPDEMGMGLEERCTERRQQSLPRPGRRMGEKK